MTAEGASGNLGVGVSCRWVTWTAVDEASSKESDSS